MSGEWVTHNGERYFLERGQTLEDVIPKPKRPVNKRRTDWIIALAIVAVAFIGVAIAAPFIIEGAKSSEVSKAACQSELDYEYNDPQSAQFDVKSRESVDGGERLVGVYSFWGAGALRRVEATCTYVDGHATIDDIRM